MSRLNKKRRRRSLHLCLFRFMSSFLLCLSYSSRGFLAAAQTMSNLTDATITGWWSSCNINSSTTGSAVDYCSGATLENLSQPLVVNLNSCYLNPSSQRSMTFFKEITDGGVTTTPQVTQFHVMFMSESYVITPTFCDEFGECDCGTELDQLKQDVGTDCNTLVTFTYRCASSPIWTEAQTCYVPAFTDTSSSSSTSSSTECAMMASVGLRQNEISTMTAVTTTGSPPSSTNVFSSPSPTALGDERTTATPSMPVVPSSVAPMVPMAPAIPPASPPPTMSKNDSSARINPGELAAAIMFGSFVVIICVSVARPWEDYDPNKSLDDNDLLDKGAMSVKELAARSVQSRDQLNIYDQTEAMLHSEQGELHHHLQDPDDDDGHLGNSAFRRRGSKESNIDDDEDWGFGPENSGRQFG